MKTKRLLYMILPIVTLILEILPYGAVCNFANPEGEPFRRTFSYFSLVPYGYTNFAPFLTAITTCVVIALLFMYALNGKYRTVKYAKILVCIAVVLSLCPLFFGIHYFSVVGALITASLVGELILIWLTVKA